jgi:hypothetical protein
VLNQGSPTHLINYWHQCQDDWYDYGPTSFEFVVLEDDSKSKIDTVISNLMLQNQTIQEFTFYIQKEDGLYVFTSSNQSLIDTKISQLTLAGQLALADSNNSYTFPITTQDERLFQTYRALTKDGQVV